MPDVASLVSNSTIYPGVFIGKEDMFLPGQQFESRVGFTNFSEKPRSLRVNALAKSSKDLAKDHVLTDITIPPLYSGSISFPQTADLGQGQHSIEIESTGSPSDLTLAFNSQATSGEFFVPIGGQNSGKTTNSGQHPWVFGNSTESYLVLYNDDLEERQIGLDIYKLQKQSSTKKKPLKPILLSGHETKIVNIRDLNTFVYGPSEADNGLITWANLETTHIFGRLIQISLGDTPEVRSFACPIQTIVCAATVSPGYNPVALGSRSNTITGYSNVCPSSGQCTCNGSLACTSNTQLATNPYWTTNGTIASLSANNTVQINVTGQATGSTLLSLSTYDQYGCSGSTDSYDGVPANIVVTNQPDHLKIVGDTTGPQSCSSGSASLRRISYEIDDVNGNPITAGISVREQFDSLSPSDGTSTCNGSLGQRSQYCTGIGGGNVGFVDGISPGCAPASAPPSCGYIWTNQVWYLCGTGGAADVVLGRPGTLDVSQAAISVGGNTGGFANGTIPAHP